jgi:hypothetical protein
MDRARRIARVLSALPSRTALKKKASDTVKRDEVPGNEPDDAQAIQRWLKEELMARASDARPRAQSDAPSEEGAAHEGTGELFYRTVDARGYLIMNGKKFYIGFFFAGKSIALRRLEGSGIELIFRDMRLGRIDVISGILEFDRERCPE